MTIVRYLLEIEHEGEPARRLMSESVLMSNTQTAIMSANDDDEDFELVGIRVELFEPGHQLHREET